MVWYWPAKKFQADVTYTLILSEQLFGVAGGKMIDEYSQSITFGELEPMIELAKWQRVIPE